MVYALIDLMHHLQQFQINRKAGTAMDLGFNFSSTNPLEVGLKYESPSLWYCFVDAFCEPHHLTDFVNAAMITPVHSNISVVFLEMTTAIFAMSGWLQFHYLLWGHQGMEYLHDTFPKTTQMAIYGFLGA